MKKDAKPANPNRPLKNPQHEQFSLLCAKGSSQADAYRATYPGSLKWKQEVVHVKASELAGKVAGRIEAIKQMAVKKAVCSIERRREILAEIAEARLHHFGTAGADGFVPNVGPENLNSAGLGGVTTSVRTSGAGGDKDDVAFVTKLKLRDPMKAIDILNKMDGVYVEKRVLEGPDGQPLFPKNVVFFSDDD